MKLNVEAKYLVEGLIFDEVVSTVKSLVSEDMTSFSSGGAIDAYWPPSSKGTASFTRLRVSDDKTYLTSNSIIKGGIRYDVNVENVNKDELVGLLTEALGDPTLVTFRCAKFKVDKDVLISVTSVIDCAPECFVDIEATCFESAVKWKTKLGAGLSIQKVRNSTYDIFVNRNGIVLSSH